MKQRFAVFGKPIAHSLSPQIHRAFAEQTGIDLSYDKNEVQPSHFAKAVARFFTQGGKGLNITMPHKQQAFQLAQSSGASAARARAANTLLYRDGNLHAESTDGTGFICDLRHNLGYEPRGKSILILGAGGVARSILPELCQVGARSITVVNRSSARLTEFKEFIGANSWEHKIICALWWAESWRNQDYDLLVNATAVGVGFEDAKHFPATVVSEQSLVYDLNYSLTTTEFLKAAANWSTTRLSDGLGMLVEQAAESFYTWHGLRPKTDIVIQQLRNGKLR